MVPMRFWRGNNSVIISCLVNHSATRPYASFPLRVITGAPGRSMKTTHDERTASELRQACLHHVYVDQITLINDDVRLVRLTLANSHSLRQADSSSDHCV